MDMQARQHRATGVGHRRGALVAVLLGFFVVMLDTTIVNVALADMGAELSAPLASLQWVVDAYTLVFAALLLTAGAACDRLGARRVYVTGLVIFGVLSAVCALAPTDGVLIAARTIQGIGAAAIVPGSLALLSGMYDDGDARARAIGLWGGAGGTAAAIGPVLGGLLVSWIGWRAVFWVNLPVIALTCWLALRSPAVPSTRHGRGLDLLGQVLSVVGLAAITYGLIAAGQKHWSGVPLASVICGVLVLVGFVIAEHHASEPMVPMALFGDARFSAAALVGLALNISFFGQLFVLSLYFQQHLGYPAWLAGLALAPQACSAVIASPLGGRSTAALGAFPSMLIGLLVGAFGFGSLVAVTDHTPYPLVAVLTFTGSFGMAFAMPAATSAAVAAAPASFTGLAGGVINAARQTGSVIGVAVLGAMIATDSFLDGFHAAVATASAVFVVASGIVAGVLVAARRSSATS